MTYFNHRKRDYIQENDTTYLDVPSLLPHPDHGDDPPLGLRNSLVQP